MKSAVYVSSYCGLCGDCSMPYYEGDRITRDSNNPFNTQFSHADCNAAREAAGGWTILNRWGFWLYVTNGAKKVHFLQYSHQGNTQRFSFEGMSYDPKNDSLNKCRWIDLADAVIEDRITPRDDAKQEHFGWAADVNRICSACACPILADEPIYSAPGTRKSRHVYKCETGVWVSTKPVRGGGTLYYPKTGARLPLSHNGDRWVAILHKSRVLKYGNTRHYFTKLDNAELMVALGKVANADALNWLDESVPEPERADEDDATKCPRCGCHGSRYHRGMKCSNATCRYEYPRVIVI